MTARYNALVVVLEKDMREDDAEGLIEAIKRMRGVLSVKGQVTTIDSHVAEDRARHDLGSKILAVIHPNLAKSDS
jgi:hypothetical protein